MNSNLFYLYNFLLAQMLAADIDMTPGESYAMDIFHAERMPGDSNFHVTTNIDCLIPVIVI